MLRGTIGTYDAGVDDAGDELSSDLIEDACAIRVEGLPGILTRYTDSDM
jgi:hypothetical protein